jgi:hypothetical protein
MLWFETKSGLGATYFLIPNCKCSKLNVLCPDNFEGCQHQIVICLTSLDSIFTIVWEPASPYWRSHWTHGIFFCKVACTRCDTCSKSFQTLVNTSAREPIFNFHETHNFCFCFRNYNTYMCCAWETKLDKGLH